METHPLGQRPLLCSSHCLRLRHVGWDKSCHGLTCSPVDSSGEGFLYDLISLLGYPNGSGAALLNGTVKLKYHTLAFCTQEA